MITQLYKESYEETVKRIHSGKNKYRLRNNSLQSNSLRNFYWIWKINRQFNKLNIFQNFLSLALISLNSLLKYGLKSF